MEETEYQEAANSLTLVGLLDVLQLNQAGLKFLFELKPYVISVWKESDRNIPLPWRLALFSVAGNLVRQWRYTLGEETLTNEEREIIVDRLIVANMVMGRYQEKLSNANENVKDQAEMILYKFVNKYDNPQLRMSEAMAISIEADEATACDMDQQLDSHGASDGHITLH